MWDKFVTGNYWDGHKVPKAHREVCHNGSLIKASRLQDTFGFFEPELNPWRTIRDALNGVPDPRKKHGIPDHIYRDGARTYAGHTGSDLDLPGKTIKAGGHGVPGGENMFVDDNGACWQFTVRDAARLQGLPDNFVVEGSWSQGMRQLGNALPVPVAKVAGRWLTDCLNHAS